ncbi:MAG: hypothetical protein COY38_00180 [Candidatus Aenigmarchaeota archaeon CG_4_10_14_0_8_um_filter_37_24]|nr:MAG: hypothetical protein AUJ50_03375 [Candidatus Aenigmarchaeota archaeon CG1_02_38_14]PIV69332.1 MAG: hypothetical protein COS07_01180 [Candidatus Aenigmarchaeota archaeon CG01_land_8_20_14_3_00_37_9]PIW41270.1 MAG: hypothetical protein COW21_02900 [Candidatus Aenigmarchaeota archaeon CG15_BIG_FIL_POST_REV_8_21_14_020_37_27]PIX50876.1 MAG: hypothetical protein COZ52_01805 [Candidatus Aenigmarchaeota archaeon CG_4_8_14_3_um_filter_37_24]PIY36010.1 MAG: hypothetical protein COZ04_01615 [Cand
MKNAVFVMEPILFFPPREKARIGSAKGYARAVARITGISQTGMNSLELADSKNNILKNYFPAIHTLNWDIILMVF